MPRRSFSRHLYLAPLVAELAARSCEVDARDLAARLLAMRVGDEISVPCCATTALPDRDRRFFHGTSWDGIIGILRQGFIGKVHHDRAQGVPLTYVAAERVMAWRYPDPWRQPTFVIGEGFPRMRFMLECSIPVGQRLDAWGILFEEQAAGLPTTQGEASNCHLRGYAQCSCRAGCSWVGETFWWLAPPPFIDAT